MTVKNATAVESAPTYEGAMVRELTLIRPAPRSAARAAKIAAPRTRDVPTPPVVDEELERTVVSLALAAVEVLHGKRASSTISRWFAPELYERIRQSAAKRAELSRSQPQRQISFAPGRPRVCRVTADIVEASVVIRSQRRHRAVSLRLETHRGRWRVTQLLTL